MSFIIHESLKTWLKLTMMKLYCCSLLCAHCSLLGTVENCGKKWCKNTANFWENRKNHGKTVISLFT